MTIAELSDREDRRLNAILFNVTEVENADSDERIHEDTAKATAILEDIGMSTEIIETRRLGKYNATNENPRPLRITVPTLKGHCIEFKYYADGIYSGLTPPG